MWGVLHNTMKLLNCCVVHLKHVTYTLIEKKDAEKVVPQGKFCSFKSIFLNELSVQLKKLQKDR